MAVATVEMDHLKAGSIRGRGWQAGDMSIETIL